MSSPSFFPLRLLLPPLLSHPRFFFSHSERTEVICPYKECAPINALVVQAVMPENTTVDEFAKRGIPGVLRTLKLRAGSWSGEFGMILFFSSRKPGTNHFSLSTINHPTRVFSEQVEHRTTPVALRRRREVTINHIELIVSNTRPQKMLSSF